METKLNLSEVLSHYFERHNYCPSVEHFFFVCSKHDFQAPYSISLLNKLSNDYLNYFCIDNVYFQDLRKEWEDFRLGKAYIEPKLQDFVS